MQTGQYIQDGTVKWIVTDIRDGDMVGDISFHPTLLPGHIKANRAAWADASIEIPRLLAWVQANNMLTTDATDESKYLYDSETDVLTLPNVMDRVIQGGNAVEAKQAGLPNIKGTMCVKNGHETQFGFVLSGNAFVGSDYGRISKPNGGGDYSSNSWYRTANLDASNASPIYSDSVTTVQPSAITLIPQIKY